LTGIPLITKGILSGPITIYNTLPFSIAINNVIKKLNLKVSELKTINILQINSKELNVQILDKDINIETNDIKQINIERS